MRKIVIGKTKGIAIIIGAAYPLVLMLLYLLYAPGRDRLPALDNPLGVLGLCGFLILSIPMAATVIVLLGVFGFLHEFGYGIPLYDSLSIPARSAAVLAIGYLVNVFYWLKVIPLAQRLNIRWMHRE